MSAPTYELSPTTRFADRARDYALFRPSYPKDAIDEVLAGLPDPGSLLIADIGAGTGISARLLADRGPRVIAVEPNAAMRESAESHPRVSFVDGTAEATGIEEAGVDIVICAQAFHWFRPAEALAEFRRITKPGGRLAFMVNERDQADPAMHAYNAAIRAAAEPELSEGMRAAVDEALSASGLATPAKAFAYAQALTREGLVGRAQSASYVPKEGPRHEQLLRDLDTLWRDHHDDQGLVTLLYRTLVWRLDLNSPPRR